MIGAAELRQSCEPPSVLIRPQHHISVFGSFFEIALLKFFKQHLYRGIHLACTCWNHPIRSTRSTSSARGHGIEGAAERFITES